MEIKLPEKLNLRDIIGSIKTVTVVPDYMPANYYGQIVLYVDALSSPSTKRLYIYSREVGAWMYVALT